jgi:chromosome segregation ATPase
MKNFLQNLLLVLALALCGLCAWQWYDQAKQRDSIETLDRLVHDRNATIQGCTNTIATLNHQVNQMDTRLTEVKAAAATNDQTIAAQKDQIAQLKFDYQTATNEIAQYRAAVDTLEAKLKDAYAGIGKQNEAITNLIAQRNEMVKKFNDEVKDRNDVVAKYNELADQVKKLQAAKKE